MKNFFRNRYLKIIPVYYPHHRTGEQKLLGEYRDPKMSVIMFDVSIVYGAAIVIAEYHEQIWSWLAHLLT